MAIFFKEWYVSVFKGNKCNPFLVLIAIDSVGICMQQFHKDGLVWLLHGVCMSCIALLRATRGYRVRWLHVCFAAPVCTMDEVPGWGKPCGLSMPPSFAQPQFLQAGRSLSPRGIFSNTSPTMDEQTGLELCTHKSGSFQHAWGELPLPAHFLQAAAASPCQGAPLPGMALSSLFCVLHTRPWLPPALSVTGQTFRQFKDLLDAIIAHNGDAWRQIFILIQDYLAG